MPLTPAREGLTKMVMPVGIHASKVRSACHDDACVAWATRN